MYLLFMYLCFFLVALLNVCVLCRGAGGGNGGVGRVPGTPDQLTDTAGSKDSPETLRREVSLDADMSEPMLHEDSMPDPFPQNAHVGIENVIYSQMELIDTDRQFRYAFVESIVDVIRKIRDQYSDANILQASKLNDAIAALPDDNDERHDKLVHQIAYYVYTNLDRKFDIAGHKDKVSFLYHYESQKLPQLAEFLYVMIFLMRAQQCSEFRFMTYKKYLHDLWVEHMKQATAKPTSEALLAEFERVLLTADDWINDIIQKEPAEKSTKKLKVAKPDRLTITLMDMINENKFTNFTQFAQGVLNVSLHFIVLYAKETGKKDSTKAVYIDALASKPNTLRLYVRVKEMFQKSNFRFKQRYPAKLIQWQYWIMRVITIFQNDNNEADLWYGYLQQAKQIVTDTEVSGHFKPSAYNFPLGADFDSLEPDVNTQNTAESLSSRIDLLNDW
jgi:hypothetical protein